MENTIVGIIFALIAFIVVVILIIVYNKIVSYKQSVQSAQSSIDVEMKKRSNLIPQLINTVKGFVQHEDEIMKNITALRANASSGVSKLFSAVAENYPVLRSSKNFLELQYALEDVEKNIAASRHIYNSNVDYYNSLINSFPALLFGFSKMQYLEFSDDFNVIEVPTNFK